MATQIINVAEGQATPAISWAGGEGHLDVYGVHTGHEIIQIEYSRDGGTLWARFEDPRSESGYWQAGQPRGFTFKLPACEIRARVVRGTPNLTLAIDAL